MITSSTLILLGAIVLLIAVIVMIWRISFYFTKRSAIKQLGSVIASEINIKLLEQKIIKILSLVIKINKADFVLVSDFATRPISSLDSINSPSIKYAQLEKMLHHIKKMMIYERLTDNFDKELFRNLGIRLIMPLIVGDEDIGLFVLGPKLSGHYSSFDIKFLQTISPQISLALKNADSYRKIEQFSQTLETKIIDRTRDLERVQAEQLKLKDEFVFIATHDLATPVTAIAGFIDLINARGQNIPAELKNYLGAISEASSRLKVLVNDLLQIARSETGAIKVDLAIVDAGKIIDATVREITPLANEKKVKIILSLSTDNALQADPIKLSEVVENLISNGIKYNREGGTLTITSRVEGTNYLLEFADTGIGIPISEHEKVFSKFFRSEGALARTRPGTGLGLFVARMLTEKMGGKISFKSVEGQGTTFYLTFNR